MATRRKEQRERPPPAEAPPAEKPTLAVAFLERRAPFRVLGANRLFLQVFAPSADPGAAAHGESRVKGSPVLEIVPEDSRAPLAAALARDPDLRAVELILPVPQGEPQKITYWESMLSVVAHPTLGEMLLFTARDSTAREEVRRSLEREAFRLGAVVHAGDEGSVFDIDATLMAAGSAAAKICGGPSAIYILNPEGRLRRTAIRAVPIESSSLVPENPRTEEFPQIARALEQRSARVVPFAQGLSATERSLMRATGGNFLMATPLVGRAGASGAILTIWRGRGAPTLEDQRAISSIASRLALALENVRLFAALEARRQALAARLTELESSFIMTEAAAGRASMVAEASRLVLESLDYRRALADLAPLAVRQLGAWCAVYLRKPAGDYERLALAQADPARPAPVDEKSLEAVLARTHRQTSESELDGTAVLVVPLLAGGRSLGALAFGTPRGASFASDDRLLAEDLARRAAVAVDRSLLYEAAQEAVRVRDEFLAIAAHELKTPITSLQLHAEILKRASEDESGTGPDAEQRGVMLNTIERECKRLTKLVGSLLDVARLRAGRLVLERTSVDIAAIARDVLMLMRTELKFAGCAAKIQSDGPTTGSWDAGRLDQVVTNLLSNAMKYGRGKPIELRVRGDAKQVRLSVQDQGIGITPDAQARIFQLFERAGASRNYAGLGLGLYIAKQIAEMHGGTLAVQSTVGRGSTFTLELPRQDGPDGA